MVMICVHRSHSWTTLQDKHFNSNNIDLNFDIELDSDIDIHFDISIDSDIDIDLNTDFEFDIDPDVTIDFDIDFDFDIDLDLDIDIDTNTDTHIDIYFNTDWDADIYYDKAETTKTEVDERWMYVVERNESSTTIQTSPINWTWEISKI